MKVINMESVKGSGKPVANQFIIVGENTKPFNHMIPLSQITIMEQER